MHWFIIFLLANRQVTKGEADMRTFLVAIALIVFTAQAQAVVIFSDGFEIVADGK